MYVQAVITATDEKVWILGFTGGVLALALVTYAVILHHNGSLTSVPISTLTVACDEFGCPAAS